MSSRQVPVLQAIQSIIWNAKAASILKEMNIDFEISVQPNLGLAIFTALRAQCFEMLPPVASYGCCLAALQMKWNFGAVLLACQAAAPKTLMFWFVGC